MKVFTQNQYAVGLNPNIQLNRARNVYFGNLEKDSFQNNSVERFFNEAEIKSLIAKTPELKKLLSENKIPVRLNMKELKELQTGHCKDTQNVAVAIVKHLPPALRQNVSIKDLKDGAMLHDFGKVLIPSEILNKKGSLNPDEVKIMNLHSEIGYLVLKNSGVNSEVLELVRCHHSNFEKNGTVKDYVPDINVQVLNIADKYSALTEPRVYKKALSPKEALTIIYGDVRKGEVHPFLFNALVKTVQEGSVPRPVKNC